jgi:hypothetical protein
MAGFFCFICKAVEMIHYYIYLDLKQTHSEYEFYISRTICSIRKRF